MTVLIVIVLNAAVLAFIAWAFSRRSQNLSSETSQARNAKLAADQRFEGLKKELSAAKEETSRRSKQLEEMRELSKRRFRKDAQKEEEIPDMTQNMTQTESTPSFELALKTVQQQAEQVHQEELAKLKSDYEQRIHKLEDQLGQRKQNLEKSKKNLEANLLTSMEGLPEEAIVEMSRLIKRSEHAEKLFAATRGKLQMSQERFSELQKRYFGVCRELALVSGHALGLSDEAIRNQAEDLLTVSDQGASA